ncbi:MAG: fused MFS/spermidine synthase [Bryobacteraceae bacterium]|nr:fused MFS/spermidine synthase [Bryobacteraceae bacterium]
MATISLSKAPPAPAAGLLVTAVAAGAFCLFLIQPLIAKLLLPSFGGGAEVWAVCLVFFQTLLLGGYLYADVLSRRLPLHSQGRVHVALAAIVIFALWLPAPDPSHAAGSPAIDLLLSLSRLIGLPYLMLASASPLLQYWHAALGAGRAAYRLYSWSNLACIAALLAYPLLIEPWFSLRHTLTAWRAAVTACALLFALLAWNLRDHPSDVPEDAPDAAPPGRRGIYGWLWLSFLGSALLLTVTNHLCRQVAPFPFLWSAPLLIYLLTFVIAFARDLSPDISFLSGLAGVTLLCAGIWYSPHDLFHPGAPMLAAGLFFLCLFCHSKLARQRPSPRFMTSYYFILAFGGALGSVFVAFLAPHLFKGEFELGAVLLGAAATLLAASLTRGRILTFTAATSLAASGAAALAIVSAHHNGLIASARGFYGSIRVADRHEPQGTLRLMLHGATIHGSQWLDSRADDPSSYYGPASGAARAFAFRPANAKVGIIGLGAGAMTAWSRKGDIFRFYEIDPWVVSLASDQFTYMKHAAGQVEVVLGDARLSLESEPPQQFDLFFVDAFSGDSIPVHLLTREAFLLYKRHMKPDGILAIHVSSRSLDLTAVVRAVATHAGWTAIAVPDRGEALKGYTPSLWMLAGPRERLAPILPPTSPPPPPERFDWSDDQSSLLHVLRHASRRR